MKNYKLHIISHTHWDREWYQPFQGFRFRLVSQIDELLRILESEPEFYCFHLDGQTCCLEDYLEIRPENKLRLQNQISNGRIAIGPWYVMPDEFVVSGEALIRNIQKGISICQEYGTEPMPAGYVTDIFGHCSQLPQILKQFGIESAFLHRGTISDENEKTEMLWQGADGSEILLVKMYKNTGYCELMVPLYVSCNEKEKLVEYFEGKKKLATTPVLFTMEGGDHVPTLKNKLLQVKMMNEILTDIECVHSSIKDYLEDLNRELDRKKLITLKGELRAPAKFGSCNDVFFGTGSARFDLKNANDKCEILLTRYAEPLNAWAWIKGGDDNSSFIKCAWKYLLLNHPHDSIVGCSIDQVHKDMLYRFDQCKMIALACATEAIRTISELISVDHNNLNVTIFNMSNITKCVSEVVLEIPISELSKYKSCSSLVLTDEQGTEYEGEIVKIVEQERSDYFMRKTEFLWGSKWHSPDFNRVDGTEKPIIAHIYINVTLNLSPFSYNTYSVRIKKAKTTIKNMDSFIENEFLKITVNSNGTINVYNKETKKTYKNICNLEDCGDSGSGWNHKYPTNDTVLYSCKGAYEIKSSITFGKHYSKITAEFKWDVPFDLDEKGENRLNRYSTLVVKNTYTLRNDKRHIECETQIENTAQRHRIRLLCPTHLKTDTVSFDTPFDIVNVPIKLLDTIGFIEQNREEHPMKSFVFIKDKNNGFGIFTRGLCEGFAKNDKDRTVGITLFRSFSFPHYASLPTQDSKHLGTLSFEYALVFTQNEQKLTEELEDYKYHLMSFSHLDKNVNPTNPIAPSGQLLKTNGLAFSSMVLENYDINIRLFNPYENELQNNSEPLFDFSSVENVDLLGNITDNPEKIKPKKIITKRYRGIKREGR